MIKQLPSIKTWKSIDNNNSRSNLTRNYPTNAKGNPVYLTDAKVKLILFSSFMLCILAVFLCFINFTVRHILIIDVGLCIGLTGYIISVKCIGFLSKQEASRSLKSITLFTIFINSSMLAFIIASLFS